VIPLSLLFVLASLGLLVLGLAATSQVLVWGSLGASIAAGVCLSVSVLQRRGRMSAVDVPPAGDVPPLPVDLGGPPAVQPPPFFPPGAGQPGAGQPTTAPASTGRPPDDVRADQTFATPPAYGGIGAEPPAARHGSAGRAQPEQAQPEQAQPEQAQPEQVEPERPAEPEPESRAVDLPAATQPAATRPAANQPATAESAAAGALDSRPADAEPAEEDIPVGAALRAAQLDDEVLVVDGRPRYHLAGCTFLTGRPTVPLALSTARRTGFTPCGLCRPDATLLARAGSRRR
jgi:hypothetical protein